MASIPIHNVCEYLVQDYLTQNPQFFEKLIQDHKNQQKSAVSHKKGFLFKNPKQSRSKTPSSTKRPNINSGYLDRIKTALIPLQIPIPKLIHIFEQNQSKMFWQYWNTTILTSINDLKNVLDHETPLWGPSSILQIGNKKATTIGRNSKIHTNSENSVTLDANKRSTPPFPSAAEIVDDLIFYVKNTNIQSKTNSTINFKEFHSTCEFFETQFTTSNIIAAEIAVQVYFVATTIQDLDSLSKEENMQGSISHLNDALKSLIQQLSQSVKVLSSDVQLQKKPNENDDLKTTISAQPDSLTFRPASRRSHTKLHVTLEHGEEPSTAEKLIGVDRKALNKALTEWGIPDTTFFKLIESSSHNEKYAIVVDKFSQEWQNMLNMRLKGFLVNLQKIHDWSRKFIRSTIRQTVLDAKQLKHPNQLNALVEQLLNLKSSKKKSATVVGDSFEGLNGGSSAESNNSDIPHPHTNDGESATDQAILDSKWTSLELLDFSFELVDLFDHYFAPQVSLSKKHVGGSDWLSDESNTTHMGVFRAESSLFLPKFDENSVSHLFQLLCKRLKGLDHQVRNGMIQALGIYSEQQISAQQNLNESMFNDQGKKLFPLWQYFDSPPTRACLKLTTEFQFQRALQLFTSIGTWNSILKNGQKVHIFLKTINLLQALTWKITQCQSWEVQNQVVQVLFQEKDLFQLSLGSSSWIGSLIQSCSPRLSPLPSARPVSVPSNTWYFCKNLPQSFDRPIMNQDFLGMMLILYVVRLIKTTLSFPNGCSIWSRYSHSTIFSSSPGRGITGWLFHIIQSTSKVHQILPQLLKKNQQQTFQFISIINMIRTEAYGCFEKLVPHSDWLTSKPRIKSTIQLLYHELSMLIQVVQNTTSLPSKTSVLVYCQMLSIFQPVIRLFSLLTTSSICLSVLYGFRIPIPNWNEVILDLLTQCISFEIDTESLFSSHTGLSSDIYTVSNELTVSMHQLGFVHLYFATVAGFPSSTDPRKISLAFEEVYACLESYSSLVSKISSSTKDPQFTQDIKTLYGQCKSVKQICQKRIESKKNESDYDQMFEKILEEPLKNKSSPKEPMEKGETQHEPVIFPPMYDPLDIWILNLQSNPIKEEKDILFNKTPEDLKSIIFLPQGEELIQLEFSSQVPMTCLMKTDATPTLSTPNDYRRMKDTQVIDQQNNYKNLLEESSMSLLPNPQKTTNGNQRPASQLRQRQLTNLVHSSASSPFEL